MAETPSYYATIPPNVRYDKNLKPSEKLLYAEITALTNKEGYCWATNAYFAKLYEVTTVSISNWISNLEDRGYIQREIIKDGKGQIVERKLFLKPNTPIKENFKGGIKENFKGGIKENFKGGIKENFKENNTSINNTRINNIYSRAEPDNVKKNKDNSRLAKEIIDYLNLKANKKFKPTTPKTKQLINARLNESFSKDDFLKVIDTKCKSWLGTEWERYLRPETLFGTKFESYLNEEVKDGYSIKSDTRKDDEQAKEWDIDGLIFTGE